MTSGRSVITITLHFRFTVCHTIVLACYHGESWQASHSYVYCVDIWCCMLPAVDASESTAQATEQQQQIERTQYVDAACPLTKVLWHATSRCPACNVFHVKKGCAALHAANCMPSKDGWGRIGQDCEEGRGEEGRGGEGRRGTLQKENTVLL